MPSSSYLDTVRDLIAENKIDDALQNLTGGVPSSAARNELVNLRRRWTEILRKEESNSEHGHILSVEKSKFTGDLLGFVDRLEALAATSTAAPAKGSSPLTKLLGGAGIILLLIFVIIWAIKDGQPANATTTPTEQSPPATKTAETNREDAKPTGEEVFDRVMSMDANSGYFSQNLKKAEMAVAVYSAKGTAAKEFSKSLTEQLIEVASWSNYATSDGLTKEFHQSSLRQMMTSASKQKGEQIPGIFPDQCPYEYLILFNFSISTGLPTGEVNAIVWNTKTRRVSLNTGTRFIRKLMGNGGKLAPSKDFYDLLIAIRTHISQQ